MDSSLTTLDTAYGGYLSLAVSGGTHQLTLAEAANPIILLSGTLSSDQYVYFPPVAGRRIIMPSVNLNGFTIYVRGNNGTDTNGVYFWTGFGIPYGIVVLPWRVHWDYGQCSPGTIADFPTGWCGNGWIPCDGRWVFQSLHDILYDVIGGTWGVSGPYFKMPDYRGTVLAMADQIGTVPGQGPYAVNEGSRGILNNWGVTTYAGESNHTLGWGEMPYHNHGVSDPGHAHGVADPGHVHGGVVVGATPYGGPFQGAISGGNFTYGNTSGAGTGIGIYGAGTNVSIQAAGGSGAHNNIQPTTCTMKMIKW
jgi:microcystin-dependent protein